MLARLRKVFRKARLLSDGVVAATIGGLAAVAVSHAAAPDAGVLGVRLGGDAAETRLVIDLDRGATGTAPQDGSGRRVVMPFPGGGAQLWLSGGGLGPAPVPVIAPSATIPRPPRNEWCSRSSPRS